MTINDNLSYNILNADSGAIDFDAVRISIASPEKIKSWSYGEITKPDTINYRTFKPERDGLFCSRIFGPTKDYECSCGKYKRMKYKGVVCEKCGVEVASSKVRRERMGHIELSCPISHIWFLKSLPSRISTILDMKQKDVESVIYFHSYIVTDARMTELENGQLLSEREYMEACQMYGDGAFSADMGAGAVREILSQIDLETERTNLLESLRTAKTNKQKFSRRLKVVESFISSGNRPEWMIIKNLPVMPPEIRPLVMLEVGRFASSDLNDLYRRVINRNNRLKKLIALNAPEIIIRNEKRMLQESVDTLLDNGRNGNALKAANKRPLKSISESLKGKTGRFRQNLLGKRVDYSGRSVIVVGPELKLNQCGLPKIMALELFRPFIYAKLELQGKSHSVKFSKKMVDNRAPEIWDILDEVIKKHPVLLNRAPTLHRLGIQAFEPILIEGNAIQLHPLVCTGFNADFDGDQMAVHIPLSIEAQIEAKTLMMSTNNILVPQSGKPIITHKQDIVLGIYYLTMESNKNKKNPVIIASESELEHALNTKKVSVHDSIIYRYNAIDENGNKIKKRINTTPGRVKVFNALPVECNHISFDMVNKVINKKELENLINLVHTSSGNTSATTIFCDRIMEIGFKEITSSGISIGYKDLVSDDSREDKISNVKKKVEEIDSDFKEGLITSGERHNKIIDEWTNCSNILRKDMMQKISLGENPEDKNSMYMMVNSGARGNEMQLQQIGAMRGLMSKTNGETVEIPITSSLKEGLSIYEYFLSTHGARKGLVDVALKTANAGYLTRRLVDVAQGCIVNEHDCHTDRGVYVEEILDNGRVVSSIRDKSFGRVLASDLIHKKETIALKGEMITETLMKKIESLSIKRLYVRSATTCACESGICAKCYGMDLTTNKIVSVGEAVGVIAAQSIGEPGTQLTLFSKHGSSSSSTAQSAISSQFDGTILTEKFNTIQNKDGKTIMLSRNAKIIIQDSKGVKLSTYVLPFGSEVFHKDGDKVKKGDYIAEWDPYNMPIIATQGGVVEYNDIIDNVSVKEKIDQETGASIKIITKINKNVAGNNMRPSVHIIDGEETLGYSLNAGTILDVSAGDIVSAGDVIARIPKESNRNKGITSGLPRVSELFEARKPKDPCIISEIDGTVYIGKEGLTNKQKIIIKSDKDAGTQVSYLVSKDKYLFVSNGDSVKAGDMIVDGKPVPQDILRILGVSEFTNYMINEIQKVYHMQGIIINDKHIEIIVAMMLRKVEVTDSGETTLMEGDVLEIPEINEINSRALENKIAPAKYRQVLLGITKSALATESFISAASFQDTTRVLTDAAISGKLDKLKGLKENIILGRLIPAGTGFSKLINFDE